MRRTAILIVIEAIVVLAMVPLKSFADIPEQFGINNRDRAMGGTGIAACDDFAATYYNPAALAINPAMELGASFMILKGSASASTRDDPSKIGRISRIPAMRTFTLGFSNYIPLKGPMGNRRAASVCGNCRHSVAMTDTQCSYCGIPLKPASREGAISQREMGIGLGMSIILPIPSLVSIDNVRARVPQWVSYDANLHRIGIILGAGFLFEKRYSFGLSLSMLADAEVFSGADVEIGGQADISFSQEMQPDMAPNFGFLYRGDNWKFGFVFRGELSLKASTTALTRTKFFGVGQADLVMKIESIALFTPSNFGVGVSYDFKNGITATFDLTWYDWSSYPAAGPQVDPAPASGISFAPVVPVEPKFKDIVVPRFGVEYLLKEGVFLRAGYYYRPSPITDDSNVNNSLVDPEKHVLTLGAEWEYDEVFSFSVFFQYHKLMSVSVTKSSAPTHPQQVTDYSVSGNIITIGLGAAAGF
ncbi:MAG: outer membrane protein transport protein [Planctomycetes bacterium]|nr:outer membrane protein transport protein [Planctomycetota bacterium]